MKRLLALTIFILAAACSGAAEEILIFGSEAKAPKVFLSNGRPAGILVDLMNHIDQQMEGETFRIELYPWKRAYVKAEQGEGGVIGFSKTEERTRNFDFSDVMYYDEMVLVVLKGKEFRFTRMEDLMGKKIGTSRGSTYGDEFERGKRTIFTVEEDTNNVQRLKKVMGGRIDAALIGPGRKAVYEAINSDPVLRGKKELFVILPRPFNRSPNYLGFHKSMKKKEFLARFNLLLDRAVEDGTLQRIIDRYEK